MYLSRNKKGYGWYSQIKSKEGESENVGYLNFTFKKGCDPMPEELNEYGSLQGELIFKDSTGAERKVFPIAKEWNGQKSIEFKLLERTNVYEDPDPTWFPKTEPKWDQSQNEVTDYPKYSQPPLKAVNSYSKDDFKDDDLPFL